MSGQRGSHQPVSVGPAGSAAEPRPPVRQNVCRERRVEFFRALCPGWVVGVEYEPSTSYWAVILRLGGNGFGVQWNRRRTGS